MTVINVTNLSKHFNLKTEYTYNYITLPNAFVHSNLLAQYINYAFTTKIDLSLFGQWNSLEDLLLKLPPELRAATGLEGTCPDCNVTIACVANLDDDPDVDVWTISTKDRPEAARGTPIHHLKDL